MNSKSSAVFSFFNLSSIQAANILAQLLLIPIISRIVGLTEFGLIMLGASYAALVSIFINFGSNQSGVKEVALAKDSPTSLSKLFFSIYIVRGLLFVITSLIFFLVSQWLLPVNTRTHFLFANMIIVGELLNPFFFFVGIQQLFLYNIINLISKILSIVLILLFIKSPADSIWVNFIVGFTQILGSLFLLVVLIQKHGLIFIKVPIQNLVQYAKQNMYLTGNNLSVQLQQSIFLFSVSAMGNPVLLGAYSLCDKVVWSFRMLIISFFNAIYPRAAILHQNNPEDWKLLKQKLQKLLWVLLCLAALILLFFANPIVHIITGKSDELAAFFIQSICLMPLVAGLNSLNVTELLLRNQYKYIFNIALILLTISILFAGLFIQWGNPRLFGFFPILVELCSIPLYLYFIKSGRN